MLAVKFINMSVMLYTSCMFYDIEQPWKMSRFTFTRNLPNFSPFSLIFEWDLPYFRSQRLTPYVFMKLGREEVLMCMARYMLKDVLAISAQGRIQGEAR